MERSENGHASASPDVPNQATWIEIDLSDLDLPAEMHSPDDLAMAAAHLYERFVPYADEGWEWLTFPWSRDFDGWVYADRHQRRIVAAARLLSRRVVPPESDVTRRASHGVSVYRTRQLTGRSWTAEPGSKRWRPFSSTTAGH